MPVKHISDCQHENEYRGDGKNTGFRKVQITAVVTTSDARISRSPRVENFRTGTMINARSLQQVQVPVQIRLFVLLARAKYILRHRRSEERMRVQYTSRVYVSLYFLIENDNNSMRCELAKLHV